MPVVQTAEDYSPTDLNLYVYADGVTIVEYTIDVDPTLNRVNVTLLGESFEDVIIRDQDGSILDFSIVDGGVLIDVLGSISVDVEYSTPDLTNKTKSLWTLFLSAPVRVVIQLPEGAAIMGFNPVPITVSFIDSRASLTMPTGWVEVSYLLGVVGTKEHASVIINDAEATLDGLRSEGIQLGEAESILQWARVLYEEAQHSRAEEQATQAKEKAVEIGVAALDAQTAIVQAKSAISSAQSEERTSQLDEALMKLQDSQDAYSRGDYTEARTLAGQALTTAQQSKSEASFLSPQVIALFGAAAIIIAVLLYRYGLKTPRDGLREPMPGGEGLTVDVDLIFEEHPDLRPDDREAIMYISESPRGAFAFELRNRLDMPKSSAWRMIRRLEEAGILETSTVGRETLVQISPKYRSD